MLCRSNKKHGNTQKMYPDYLTSLQKKLLLSSQVNQVIRYPVSMAKVKTTEILNVYACFLVLYFVLMAIGVERVCNSIGQRMVLPLQGNGRISTLIFYMGGLRSASTREITKCLAKYQR